MSFMWLQQGLFRPQSYGFWFCRIIFYTNILSLLEVCRVRSETYTNRDWSLLGCNTCQYTSNSWHGPSKCQEWLAKQHSTTFQKTWILSNANVRTSNLTLIQSQNRTKSMTPTNRKCIILWITNMYMQDYTVSEPKR